MKSKAYRVKILRRWSMSAFCGIIAFFPASAVFPEEALPDWNISLNEREYVPSALTVWNRCSELHDFQVENKNLSFVHFIGDARVGVKGHSYKIFPIFFNTRDLEDRIYAGELAVQCTSCAEEPGCAQDKSVLPVRLTVSHIPAEIRLPANDTGSAGYREERMDASAGLPMFCKELGGEAWSARYRAEVLETNAESARTMAERTGNAAEYFEKLAARKTYEAREHDSRRSGGNASRFSVLWKSADVLLRQLVPDHARHSARNRGASGSSQASRNRSNPSSRPKEEDEAAEALDNAVEARIAGKMWGKAVTAAEDAARTARAVSDEARRSLEACISR